MKVLELEEKPCLLPVDPESFKGLNPYACPGCNFKECCKKYERKGKHCKKCPEKGRY